MGPQRPFSRQPVSAGPRGAPLWAVHMPGMGWCQADVPGAQGSRGAGQWQGPAVPTAELQSRGCQLLTPALLPGQQTSSLPCTAEALPESHIPDEILVYSSLAGEKDGLGFIKG